MNENEETIDWILNKLKEEFELTIGESDNFVGMEIEQRKNWSIFLYQTNYIKQLVKRFNLEKARTNCVPADYNVILCANKKDVTISGFPYREAVGSLIFAFIVSRPNITFAAGNVSRFLINPDVIDINVKELL